MAPYGHDDDSEYSDEDENSYTSEENSYQPRDSTVGRDDDGSESYSGSYTDSQEGSGSYSQEDRYSDADEEPASEGSYTSESQGSYSQDGDASAQDEQERSQYGDESYTGSHSGSSFENDSRQWSNNNSESRSYANDDEQSVSESQFSHQSDDGSYSDHSGRSSSEEDLANSDIKAPQHDYDDGSIGHDDEFFNQSPQSERESSQHSDTGSYSSRQQVDDLDDKEEMPGNIVDDFESASKDFGAFDDAFPNSPTNLQDQSAEHEVGSPNAESVGFETATFGDFSVGEFDERDDADVSVEESADGNESEDRGENKNESTFADFDTADNNSVDGSGNGSRSEHDSVPRDSSSTNDFSEGEKDISKPVAEDTSDASSDSQMDAQAAQFMPEQEVSDDNSKAVEESSATYSGRDQASQKMLNETHVDSDLGPGKNQACEDETSSSSPQQSTSQPYPVPSANIAIRESPRQEKEQPGSMLATSEPNDLSSLFSTSKASLIKPGERSVGSFRSGISRRSNANHRSPLKKDPQKTTRRYSRDQMVKLSHLPRSEFVFDNEHEVDPTGKERRGKVRLRNKSLLDLTKRVTKAVSTVRATIDRGAEDGPKQREFAGKLLMNFEELTGVFLRLSDEQQLLSTFAKKSDPHASDALDSILSYCNVVNSIFEKLEPVLTETLEEDMGEDEMEDYLYGMHLTAEQLCRIGYRVGDRHDWSARANTAYVTLLELLARDALEVSCIFEDIDTPSYRLTDHIQTAWEATGHDDEIQTLVVTFDIAMFRQICYEVMLSCDQWCPDTTTLLDICAIEENESDDEEEPNTDEELTPTPEAAVQVLEKITGEPLPRLQYITSILRRILPPEAVSDSRVKDSFAKVRSTVRNPLGLSPSTLVSITAISEDPDNEDALAVAGVGKSTVAAMIANHEDVRRFFRDGIAWIYIGPTELDYSRYVQCLEDILGQLEVDEEVEPVFPELLHTAGESKAKRRRREEGFMIFVREIMVEFLERKNVLIVLDDVCFDPDLDWFDFTPPVPTEEEEGSCVVLTTSRRRNLLPAADTVEVEMLDTVEGVQLLVKESGPLAKALNRDSPHIQSAVAECAGHALAVKSIGRWLNLKHGSSSIEDLAIDSVHEDVANVVSRVIASSAQEETDMMYEILSMSMSPAIEGKATLIMKFCFAAFTKVFCDKKFISDYALADSTPLVPMGITEKLFEALLILEEESLMIEGSLVNRDYSATAALIPEALSALGVFKVIITYVDEADEKEGLDGVEDEEEKYYQIMHKIQHEYGEHLYDEDRILSEFSKEGERRWNRAFAQAYMSSEVDWVTETPDACLDYALEAMPSHLYRGGLLQEATSLLCDKHFVRGRLFALGRENGTKRHIKDCEDLFDLMLEQRSSGKKNFDPKGSMIHAFEVLGDLLYMDEDELIASEGSPEAVEVGRSHFDIGFSLAEKRCWDAAIEHWEKSQELLVSSLGMVELVAGVLYSVGVVYCAMNEYEQALGSLKQCLKIRGAIHGEEHILYAQTIQKIGDVFLSMSDYHEAMESYNWALDVMHIEPNHHRIDIGDILENMGNIHFSKGEIDEALQSFQDALRSRQVDLGEDHPELANTFRNIGDCLSDEGKTEEAIAHFEEAIRLKTLDPEGGDERDADVLTIQGILHNLHGKQRDGLECYEKALQLMVTRVAHKKERIAYLLHLIGCVYLMSGEHKKAMKLFEESLQARRKVLGFIHLDVASTLFNMAFLHQTRNRLDKALKCLEEALKIRQLRLPDSERVAVTHEKIGNLARAVGKTRKAELAFTEALRIRKLVHGENHVAVASVLQELGDLMDDRGDFDSAMKHYVQALAIREAVLGPDDLAAGETYYSMGYTLQNNQAMDRALQCFEEALSIRKYNLGDDAKEVGDTLNMMGYLQAQQGELNDAISLLWEALRIRKLHEDPVKVSETLKNIGNVHREKQEFELAVECYDEVLRIRRTELGDNHEKLADALVAMGNVQGDMNSNEEAMESYKEALTIRIRLFGEQDESVASVLQYMGTLEFRAAELDRAFQLLDEFIRIRQENGTEPDGDYVNVLFMIGNIHKMQGKEDEAQICWTEAYDVFQELGLADGNPQIAEVMGTLVKEAGKDRKRRRKKAEKAKQESAAPYGSESKESGTKGVFGRIANRMKGGNKGNRL